MDFFAVRNATMARFALSKSGPPIVLLTDFGHRDSYVGVMKGVIRSICSHAEVIDLCHNIMPHDIAEAAFVLAASYKYFPEGSIFVCVVDPGVGTDRAILCMRANRQLFLAPDNGLLSVVANEAGRESLRKVTEQKYFLKETSATFHGRDIFAPVAAHLANGVRPSRLGPKVPHMRRLQLPSPVRTADGKIRGEVIYIDQFGNLITNISNSTLRRGLGVGLDQVAVQVKRRLVRGISTTYADRPEGELVALLGSSGYLEVAVNRGSAAAELGCEKGDSVTITAV